jgi:DNA processing protein
MYGKAVCDHLIRGLRGYPIVIVSGLALGIDGIAHRAALAAGLTTVAVPGSGLHASVLYPSAHRPLADEILNHGGALVSEFEPDFHATTWGFPQRNRIMAGLSDAILVIEAAIKSGTLITARLAADYNRDVLVVPGSILSEVSAGPNFLTKLGATPITGSADIVQALGLPAAVAHDRMRTATALKTESTDEQRVAELLAEPTPRDELIRRMGGATSAANTLLTIMEIKGYIKEEMGTVMLNP